MLKAGDEWSGNKGVRATTMTPEHEAKTCRKGHRLVDGNFTIRKEGCVRCLVCRKIQHKKQKEKYHNDSEFRKQHILRTRKWQTENSKLANAYSRRWKRDNKEAVLAYNQAYKAAKRRATGKLEKTAIGETFRTMLNQNTLYAVVSNAVSKGLEAHIRDDLISSVILAVLEGNLTELDIINKSDKYRQVYSQGNTNTRTKGHTSSLDTGLLDKLDDQQTLWAE